MFSNKKNINYEKQIQMINKNQNDVKYIESQLKYIDENVNLYIDNMNNNKNEIHIIKENITNNLVELLKKINNINNKEQNISKNILKTLQTLLDIKEVQNEFINNMNLELAYIQKELNVIKQNNILYNISYYYTKIKDYCYYWFKSNSKIN
jgi:Rad3-related DNA helicase